MLQLQFHMFRRFVDLFQLVAWAMHMHWPNHDTKSMNKRHKPVPSNHENKVSNAVVKFLLATAQHSWHWTVVELQWEAVLGHMQSNASPSTLKPGHWSKDCTTSTGLQKWAFLVYFSVQKPIPFHLLEFRSPMSVGPWAIIDHSTERGDERIIHKCTKINTFWGYNVCWQQWPRTQPPSKYKFHQFQEINGLKLRNA